MRWKQAKWWYDQEIVRERLQQGKRDVAFLKAIKFRMSIIPMLLPKVKTLSNEEIFILYGIFMTGEVPALCSLMRNNDERQRILANIWRQVNMETTLSALKNAKKRPVFKKKNDKALKNMKKSSSVHLMPTHFSCDMHSAATVQPTVKTARM